VCVGSDAVDGLILCVGELMLFLGELMLCVWELMLRMGLCCI
jgi:hypothetical protein